MRSCSSFFGGRGVRVESSLVGHAGFFLEGLGTLRDFRLFRLFFLECFWFGLGFGCCLRFGAFWGLRAAVRVVGLGFECFGFGVAGLGPSPIHPVLSVAIKAPGT